MSDSTREWIVLLALQTQSRNPVSAAQTLAPTNPDQRFSLNSASLRLPLKPLNDVLKATRTKKRGQSISLGPRHG